MNFSLSLSLSLSLSDCTMIFDTPCYGFIFKIKNTFINRSTSRLDIIQLIPINENVERTCSSAILIQTITRESNRNTAIVLAEDVNNGQFLRCDVIVDVIFSLNLVTTTRELYIEEAPEAFEVRAYDEQGKDI